MIDMSKQFDTIVVGLGKTGFSCARYLADQGVNFAVADHCDKPPMLEEMETTLPEIPLYLGDLDGSFLSRAKNLVLSPGVPLQQDAIVEAVNSGVEVYGDVELFCQHISAPVIAITGTNGKSTVTALITEILRAASLKVFMGGNLGHPVLDLLTEEPPDFYVLELSSFQLETVHSLNAVAAVVLNVQEDHMNRYQDITQYAEIKERIYKGTGTMIINMDDPAVVRMIQDDRTVIGITLSEPESEIYGLRQYSDVQWIVKGNEKLIMVDDIRMKGSHNILNVMAAMALVEIVACPRESVLSVLRSFAGLQHRCQKVFEYAGVAWINDSKATNVAAAYAAINSLSNNKNIILIAGGDSKGADFTKLQKVAYSSLKAVITLGQDGHKVCQLLCSTVSSYVVNSICTAVEVAASIATEGDIVLLSPACASYDMFDDYQMRGKAFVNAIKKVFGDQYNA